MKEFHDVMLLDIRSRFEFDVLSIKTSINLPIEKASSLERIKRFVQYQPDIKIIVIDNNDETSRPFEAARLLQRYGLHNVRVYDEGVFSWLWYYPERTRLMGESPAKINTVIPISKTVSHSVNYNQFSNLSKKPDALVIDTRDIYQQNIGFVDLEYINIPFESLLHAISNRIWAEKQLLFFDATSQRYQMLQLFLQASGYYDYYFLEGGVESVSPQYISQFNNQSAGKLTVNQQTLLEKTREFSKTEHFSSFFNYILSSIKTQNLAFVNPASITEQLGLPPEAVLELSEKLSQLKAVRFIRTPQVYIYVVDPQIAWKGEMDGGNWQRSTRLFHGIQ